MDFLFLYFFFIVVFIFSKNKRSLMVMAYLTYLTDNLKKNYTAVLQSDMDKTFYKNEKTEGGTFPRNFQFRRIENFWAPDWRQALPGS